MGESLILLSHAFLLIDFFPMSYFMNGNDLIIMIDFINDSPVADPELITVLRDSRLRA